MTERDALEVKALDELLGNIDPYAWYDAALKVYDGEDAGRVSINIARDLESWNDPTWWWVNHEQAAARLELYLVVLREAVEEQAAWRAQGRREAC